MYRLTIGLMTDISYNRKLSHNMTCMAINTVLLCELYIQSTD